MLKNFKRAEDGLSKEEKKKYAKYYQGELTALQQRLKDSKIPVAILVEGPVLSGKSPLVNEIVSELDPRFCTVFALESLDKKSKERAFLEPFWNAIPENGRIQVYEGGWAGKAVNEFVKGKISDDEFAALIKECNAFERQLINNGYLLIKIYLCTSKNRISKVYDEIEESGAWVESKKLKKQVKLFPEYTEAFDRFMTGSKPGSWNIIASEDMTTLRYDTFKLLYEKVGDAIKNGKFNGKEYRESFPMVKMPKLAEVDLSPAIDPAEYKPTLKAAQARLEALQHEIVKKGIPVVIAFEGWDAAGKGSAIRRLVYPIDPRIFTVHPIASPEPHEKNRHHLWRFWQRMPQRGHFAIFDRTWYGRVMVERLEGFCTENDWKRAYAEINEFEKTLSDWGAVVIKFWLHIDKDTQLARFTDRQNTPEKQWKITDEDWRNREKWDLYEGAINDMIKKTSTVYAPWTIVEAVDKPYARIKVINTVCDRLAEALEK